MNFREHVRADVESWGAAGREDLVALWRIYVAGNFGGEWAKYPAAEVELRAWLLARQPVARDPVVLNRHHLIPSKPQPIGSADWPAGALYCGRPPISAPPTGKPGGELWRYAHALGNPYTREDYPDDALERYRLDLRRWLREDNAAAVALAADPRAKLRHHPAADAIRDITPTSALVCSCVSSPWTPEIAVKPDERLPASVVCHCHLIVAAWRAMQKKPRAQAAASA